MKEIRTYAERVEVVDGMDNTILKRTLIDKLKLRIEDHVVFEDNGDFIEARVKIGNPD